MLNIDEALQLVLANSAPLAATKVPLHDSLGKVLAEDVTSDIDSPPHDKSVVDGFALDVASLASATGPLQILEEITAGMVPTQNVRPGFASRIMTGAPIPAGADGVVMVEKTELVASAALKILETGTRSGQNIARRASSMARGSIVLRKGQTVHSSRLGLLAEVGQAEVKVFPSPQVAVLVTGNELVPVSTKPGPGQIRNSNGPMLAALVQRAGGVPVELEVARDDAGELERLISQGLQADVLLLSGGVSAGVLDLVPGALAKLGVSQIFHKINLKPGKPLWFGQFVSKTGHKKLVFGLPGNPVSSLVCFELFVRPALDRLAGGSGRGLPESLALLTTSHFQRGDRPTYWPARCDFHQGKLHATPLPWQGSGDLCTLADADGLAYFPAGDLTYAAGTEITVLRWT